MNYKGSLVTSLTKMSFLFALGFYIYMRMQIFRILITVINKVYFIEIIKKLKPVL